MSTHQCHTDRPAVKVPLDENTWSRDLCAGCWLPCDGSLRCAECNDPIHEACASEHDEDRFVCRLCEAELERWAREAR